MIDDKLRNCFDEMVVYKDLKKSNFFNALSLPSFMRDWILKKFEDNEGNFDTEQVAKFVRKYLPKIIFTVIYNFGVDKTLSKCYKYIITTSDTDRGAVAMSTLPRGHPVKQ